MKKIRNFYICSFLIPHLFFTFISHAMEISLETKPRYVGFIDNSSIIFTSLDMLIFRNIHTDQCTHYEQDAYIDDFAINKDKSKVAVSCNGVIRVYNTQNKEKVWEYDTQSFVFVPLAFNSQGINQLFAHVNPNNLLLLESGNVVQEIGTKDRARGFETTIVSHPCKRAILYQTKESGCRAIEEAEICLSSCAEGNSTNELISYPILDVREAQHFQLSSNNAYHIVGDSYQIASSGFFIKSINANRQKQLYEGTHCPLTNNYFRPMVYYAIAFHPNNTFFVTLSEDFFLKYWNCEKCCSEIPQAISSRQLMEYIPETDASTHRNILDVSDKRIDFSPDGEWIVIALKNKLFILKVPFNVLHRGDIYEKSFFLWWCLQNSKVGLVKDLQPKIMHTFLDVHKY